jgi:hypothetical protein
MRGNTQTTAARRRRRLAIWSVFAALGISMGVVWATGFGSVTSQAGAGSSGSTPLVHSPGVNSASDLSSTVTARATPFDVTWDGLWGSTVDTNFFQVDLGSLSGNYNVAVLLTNGTSMQSSGWTSLQLKLGYVAKASGSTCADSDFSGALTTPRVMTFDNADTGVYWNGLAGGSVYCVGMKAWTPPSADGYTLDPNDTFVRRATTSDPTHYPELVATVDHG